jgi:hypothetical protein
MSNRTEASLLQAELDEQDYDDIGLRSSRGCVLFSTLNLHRSHRFPYLILCIIQKKISRDFPRNKISRYISFGLKYWEVKNSPLHTAASNFRQEWEESPCQTNRGRIATASSSECVAPMEYSERVSRFKSYPHNSNRQCSILQVRY